MPADAELELVPIEVPAGGAAFHDGWTFHGSPPNERADARAPGDGEPHDLDRHALEPGAPARVYSKFRRPGELDLDEAFFPVMWRADGHRTPWIDTEFAPDPIAA